MRSLLFVLTLTTFSMVFANPVRIKNIAQIDALVLEPGPHTLEWTGAPDNVDEGFQVYDALLLAQAWDFWILPSGEWVDNFNARIVVLGVDPVGAVLKSERQRLFVSWIKPRVSYSQNLDIKKWERLLNLIPADLDFLKTKAAGLFIRNNLYVSGDFPPDQFQVFSVANTERLTRSDHDEINRYIGRLDLVRFSVVHGLAQTLPLLEGHRNVFRDYIKCLDAFRGKTGE